MSVTVSQLVQRIVIQGDTEAKSKLSGMNKAAQETSGGFKGILQSALSIAGGLGIFNLASQAVGFLKDQAADMFKVTMEHQDVLKQTADVIKSTGDASGMSAKQIADLASSLEQSKVYSRDVTEAGENLLLTFTNIGSTVMPQATATMLDMSKAMGQDVKSSAIQMGKALNDPEKGITALSRVGVTFTQQQKDQIKAMQDAGNMAGAQKIILGELSKEFGGSADAGKTLSGQMELLKNKLTDVKQNIGDALMPILLKLGNTVVSNVMPSIQKFSDFMSSPAFQRFASDTGQKIVDAFKSIGDFVKNNVVPAVNSFMGVLKSPQFADFVSKLKDLGSTLLSVVGPAFTDAKPKVDTLFTFIKTTALPALTDLVKDLTDTVKWLKDHGTAVSVTAGIITALYVPALIKSGVEAVIAGTKTAVSYVANIIKVGVEGFQAMAKLQAFIINIIASGVEAVIAGGKIAISFVGNLIKSGTEAALAGGKIAVSFVASMIKAGVEAVIAGGKIVISFIASLITTGVQAAITGGLIVASFVASLVSAGIEAIVSAGIFLITLVPSLLAVAAAVIAATWPFLLIAAIVALVVVGIILAIQHWGDISKWLTGVWNNVATWFKGFWDGIVKLFGNIGGWFHDRWTEAYNGVTKAFGNIGKWFSDTWNTIKNDALNAGGAVIKMLADGINGAIHFVTDAIHNVTQWISDHLPHSPAKIGPLVNLAEQGASIVDQVSNGMMAGMPKLSTALNALTKPINMSLSPGAMSNGVSLAPIGVSNQQPIIIHNYIDGKQITDNVGPRLIKSGRTNGPLRSGL